MCPPQALRRPQTQAACLPNIQEKKKKAEAHGIHTGCGQGEFIWILDQQSQRPVGVRDLRTEKKKRTPSFQAKKAPVTERKSTPDSMGCGGGEREEERGKSEKAFRLLILSTFQETPGLCSILRSEQH